LEERIAEAADSVLAEQKSKGDDDTEEENNADDKDKLSIIVEETI